MSQGDDNDFIYLSRNVVEQKRAQLRELFALTCLSLTIPTLESFCFCFFVQIECVVCRGNWLKSDLIREINWLDWAKKGGWDWSGWLPKIYIFLLWVEERCRLSRKLNGGLLMLLHLVQREGVAAAAKQKQDTGYLLRKSNRCFGGGGGRAYTQSPVWVWE